MASPGAVLGAGVPFAGGRHGPLMAPSMRATRSARACRSRRTSHVGGQRLEASDHARLEPIHAPALRQQQRHQHGQQGGHGGAHGAVTSRPRRRPRVRRRRSDHSPLASRSRSDGVSARVRRSYSASLGRSLGTHVVSMPSRHSFQQKEGRHPEEQRPPRTSQVCPVYLFTVIVRVSLAVIQSWSSSSPSPTAPSLST